MCALSVSLSLSLFSTSSLLHLSKCRDGMNNAGCGNPCFASCPAATVTIQPPPFILTIPGPALYCPDQPFAIEQCNPCANNYAVGNSSLHARGGANLSSFYSQAMPSSSYNYSSCRSCHL
uniref:Uncharacterized protein n=1 Tax=Varanus komodoensis TaxID=61221 RepID=A0A8D2J9S2_VARKO